MEHTLRGHINALHALTDDEETRSLLIKDLSDETLRGVLEGLATFLLEEVARQAQTQAGAEVRAVELAGAQIKEDDEDSLLGEVVDDASGDKTAEQEQNEEEQKEKEKADIGTAQAPITTEDSVETRYEQTAEDPLYSKLDERNILPTKLRSRASSSMHPRTKKRARKSKNTVIPLDEAKSTHEDTDSEVFEDENHAEDQTIGPTHRSPSPTKPQGFTRIKIFLSPGKYLISLDQIPHGTVNMLLYRLRSDYQFDAQDQERYNKILQSIEPRKDGGQCLHQFITKGGQCTWEGKGLKEMDYACSGCIRAGCICASLADIDGALSLIIHALPYRVRQGVKQGELEFWVHEPEKIERPRENEKKELAGS